MYRELAAAAVFVRGGTTLWGRFWGARADFDALHFELCYHLPIAWGLPRGIARIEAGAQGPHKLKRGYLVADCPSVHRLGHPAFHRAVEGALDAEREDRAGELAYFRAHSPYARAPRPSAQAARGT